MSSFKDVNGTSEEEPKDVAVTLEHSSSIPARLRLRYIHCSGLLAAAAAVQDCKVMITQLPTRGIRVTHISQE